MQMPSSISTRLQYQHKSLLDIIDGLSDDQVHREVVPGKWSIFQHIAHLSCYQHVMIDRIRKILDGDAPVLGAYVAEEDPCFEDICKKSTVDVMRELLGTRKSMAGELNGFAEYDLAKKGVHEAYGEMNLVQCLNFFLLHEAHHLFAIFKLAARLKTVAAV
ncbi:DinB family protein [Nostoc ellipsosporum NOK]|nr:DinB family protein [Nostoc ellipsosporum NOK]